MAVKLKSFTIANFGPFAEKTTFSTVAETSKKELLDENTFIVGDYRYNRVSYIYGFNGVGKSNFCKALLQVQNIIIMSPLVSSPNLQLMEHPFLKNYYSIDQNCFKFDKTYEDKSTYFQIEIVLNGIVYTYTFELQQNKIIKERLTKKYRRTEILIERTSPKYEDITLRSEFKGFEDNIKVVKENALCLSMAAFLNEPLALELKDAIMSIKVVNMAAINNLSTIEERMLSDDKLQQYLQVLKFADPTLNNIKVSYNEKKVEHQRLNIPDFENREIVIRNVEVDVTSSHNRVNEFNEIESIDLPFLQVESNGTIKLFGILPVIFNALEQGGVVIIDEIDNGLHPAILSVLVDLFAKSNNVNDAQLICSSHNIDLIKNNVRRDQIWIISKDNKGKSSISRVSDIPGIRAYESNGEKYLEKAFGSIPHALFS